MIGRRLYACDTCGTVFLYLMQPYCLCGGIINPTPFVALKMDPTVDQLADEGDALVREAGEALDKLQRGKDSG